MTSIPAFADRVPVLIAGGGPVGLTLAALLGRFGVRCLVIEADASYCSGSRAICLSRRSQEIFGWVDGERPLTATGLPWTGGRSYFRAAEVLHFRMPSDPRERFAPMINIQQFHVEEIAHRAAQAAGAAVDVRWSSRVVGLRQHASGVDVTVAGPDGARQVVQAGWLVACDGGRSTVREQSGLAFEGMQYEGRYVIVDIEQASTRPVERLAWFDPPSNRGSTILMHRQPGGVWRIDYQIADDEDPLEAVKPENVLPRVQSHLQMIGETAPWKPLWISIYNAKCLTLADYRDRRVLFAGDAAHLVPIFGVRGLNSGLDDAGNLAWKLALVLQGAADTSLLDTYSQERVHATRQNLAYGAKSTEFMAPPHAGFTLMREAALRLAGEDALVRSLINPRQSTPIRYDGSALNLESAGDAAGTASPAPRAGDTAPEARLGGRHLTTLFGHGFVALWFSDRAASGPAFAVEPGAGLASLAVWRIARTPVGDAPNALFDDAGEAWQRYAATDGCVVLVRPDGYLLGRWAAPDAATLAAALAPFRHTPIEAARP
ncbi:MAG TPA: FAD-dependent monooxygenase [Burkholderiaceae bacterium]